MDIIDSITKQIIKEDESVILMFLVNSRSENNSVGLLTRPHDQYRLASLPIQAVWTGHGFQSTGHDQLAISTLAKSLGMDESGSLDEIVESLWDYGSKINEKPSWNCSSMQEYSIFATRTVTIDKLSDVSAIRENVPLLTAADHFKLALPHALAHIKHWQIPNDSVPEHERIDHYMESDRLSRMFYLKSSHGYDDDYQDPIPYAAYALNRSSEPVFSGKLISALHKERFLTNAGTLDEALYESFYEGTHLGAAITHALTFLDIPLAPCHWAQSAKRTTAKMEFMSKVLIEDLREHCDEVDAYDDNPQKVVRDLIAPLKSCVGDLTRLQHGLEEKQNKR